MNITNLIVELVKQGKSVEVPGIGTFRGEMQQSYHDTAKHVFYPAGIKVSFDNVATGDETMVDEIAKCEFVSRDIARQMWQNYIDALSDRVKQNGSQNMGDMGVLSLDGDKKFTFAMTQDVLIPEGGQQPLYDVRTYDHSDEEDPFAAYEPEDVPTIATPTSDDETPKVEVESEPEPQQTSDNMDVEPEPLPESTTESEVQTTAEIEDDVIEQEVEQEVVVEQNEPEVSIVENKDEESAPAEVENEEVVAEENVVVDEPDADQDEEMQTATEEETVSDEPVVTEEEIATEEITTVETKEVTPVQIEENVEEKPSEGENIEQKDVDEGHNNERELDPKAMRREQRLIEKAEKKASRDWKTVDYGDDKERLKAEKRAAALAAMAEKAEAEAAAKAEEEAKKQAEIEAQIKAREQEKIDKENEIKRLKEEEEAAKEMRKLEKEQRKAQKKLDKEQKKIEAEQKKLDAKQQKKELAEQKRLEKEQKKLQKKQAKNSKEAQQLADELLNPVTPVVNDGEKKEEKKGKRKCRWILWVVLLLCVLAVVAFLLCHGKCGKVKPSKEGQEKVETLLRKAYIESIDYSSRDIEDNSYAACRFVEPYVIEFLSQNNYTNARVPVMNRLQAYALQRMNGLLSKRFAWIESVPYTNYVFDYNRADFKDSRACAARCKVQGELMDRDFLDSIFHQTIEKLGLKDDGTMQRSAEEVKRVQEQERAQLAKRNAANSNQLLRYVTVRDESKKGFDIIAGFYLNKHVAADLTARLYDMGCDAYIIEKNEYYYVSMGSAATRTEAEAKMKHIKEWYDGDVAIKQL